MFKLSSINLINTVLLYVVPFIIHPIIIRALGADGYALFSTVVSVAGIIQFLEFGLSNALLVRLGSANGAGSKDKDKLYYTASLGILALIAIVSGATIYLARNWISTTYFSGKYLYQPGEIGLCVGIGFVTSIFKIANNINIALFQNSNQYAKILKINLAASIVTILLIVAAQQFAVPLYGYLAIMLAGPLIVFTYLFAKNVGYLVGINGVPDLLGASVELFRVNLVVWFGMLGSMLYSQADRLVLAAVLVPKDFALYSFCTNILRVINGVYAAISQPLLPIMKEQIASGNLENAREYYAKFLRMSCLLTAAIITGGLLLAKPFLTTFGAFIFEGRTFLIYALILVNVAIYSNAAVGYYTLLAFKRLRVFSSIQFGVGVVTILSLYLGAQEWGVLGAVVGGCVYSTILLLNVAAVRMMK